MILELTEFYWRKVDKAPGHGPHGDCWVWTGNRSKEGYGRHSFRGRLYLAHRFVFIAIHGPVCGSDGYNGTVICHACDNPSCVNPAHLFAGPGSMNQADKMRKKRHAFGERSGRALLNETDVQFIRDTDRGSAELARMFGVAPNTISAVRTGDSWKHLT